MLLPLDILLESILLQIDIVVGAKPAVEELLALGAYVQVFNLLDYAVVCQRSCSTQGFDVLWQCLFFDGHEINFVLSIWLVVAIKNHCRLGGFSIRSKVIYWIWLIQDSAFALQGAVHERVPSLHVI